MVGWVIPVVTSNMIWLIVDEATPSLGLASGRCRLKLILKDIIALKLLLFCAENQLSWISESQGLLGHSPFESLDLQRPSTPIEIIVGSGLSYLGVSIFH